jgi:hypothetical protein
MTRIRQRFHIATFPEFGHAAKVLIPPEHIIRDAHETCLWDWQELDLAKGLFPSRVLFVFSFIHVLISEE